MLTVAQTRKLEQDFVKRGGDLHALTERIGYELARAIEQQFIDKGTVIAYLGKGGNAADALVALEHLRASGWRIGVRCAYPAREMSSFARSRLQQLQAQEFSEMPRPRSEIVLLVDALLGIGAEGEPRGEIAELVGEMNTLRQQARARTIAVDVPTGLDADSGEAAGSAVMADVTCCALSVKVGLVSDRATAFVGRLVELRVPGLEPEPWANAPEEADAQLECLRSDELASLLKFRKFETHKGSAGRVAILAGSEGMWGAANLCAKAALAGGAGMVTLYCKTHEAMIPQLIKPDEVIVKPVQQYIDVAGERFNSLVIGPGMVQLSETEIASLWKLIQNTTYPMVLDAGGMYFGIRVGSSRVDLQACKLEYSIVSPK